MTITATEFKTHFGKYIDMAKEQDIYITKNNKRVAKLTSPVPDRKSALDAIAGLLEGYPDMTLEQIKDERLARQ